MGRLLTKREAAERCAVTPSAFDQWKRKGIVPGPVPGTRRYDAKALDLALDKAMGLSSDEPSKFAEWKRKREDQAAGREPNKEAPR
jgi:DNA-binding transcriptional MerR regulator